MTSYTRVRPQTYTRKGYGFHLEIIRENGSRQSHEFETLAEMARALYRIRYSNHWVPSWDIRTNPSRHLHWLRGRVRAWGPQEGRIDPLDLCKFGERLSCYRHRDRQRRGPDHQVYRGSPAPRVWNNRGGPSQRPARTMAARRQSVGWFPEEGETEVRSSRRENYFPDSRDDGWRQSQRSWKEQHTGRKSWDR